MNKKIIVILFLLVFLSLPFFASAQTTGPFNYVPLEKIPGSDKETSGVTDFYTYVSAIYKFGIWAVGIVALFMLVFGGYTYITSAGNNSSMETAKKIITDAIVGIIMALTAYLLLYVINPDLVRMKKLAPVAGIPGAQVPVTPVPGVPGVCNSTTSGTCGVSAMQSSCFASVAEQASAICMQESSGRATITNPVATCSGQPVVIGLFQINISANPVGSLNCRSAFSSAYSNSKTNCQITNQSLYDQCVTAAKDPATNISAACAIYNGPRKWNSWEANSSKCHF